MKRTFLFSALSAVLMSAATEGGEGSAAAAPAAVDRDTAKIRPNLEGYQTVKSASGSSTKICGDEVSKALLGATLDEAYVFVSGVVEVPEADLRAKYGSRNLGQQRMFLGNLIRGAFAGKDAEKASRVSKAFEAALPAFRESVDGRLQTIADELKAQKEEKLAAKQKAKDEAKAKAEADKEAKAAAKTKEDEEKAAKKAQKDADKEADRALKAAAKTAAKAPTAPVEPK